MDGGEEENAYEVMEEDAETEAGYVKVDPDVESQRKKKETRETAEQTKGKKKNKPRKEYIPALLCVDTFSKFCAVQLIDGDRKTGAHVYTAVHEAFENMGVFQTNPLRHPQTVYSDR
jgi:hypothetical protein